MSITSTITLADAWGMHGDIGTGWWIVMVAATALFWGLVILVAVRLLWSGFGGRQQARTEGPLEVLDRRFAEGALAAEDYRERREILTSHAPAANRATDPAEESATPFTAAGTHAPREQ